MSYARTIDNPMIDQQSLPESATLLADPGKWITGLPNQTVEVQHSTGWYEVVTTPRPPDTDTHTTDRSLVLVSGIPTEKWTSRPWTQAELDARTKAKNHQTLMERISVAIDTLLLTVDNLNAITDIPNATINANPAAVIKDVARECKTIARQTIDIARVVSGELDSTDNGS